MSRNKKEPKLDKSSPLADGHAWIWVPVLVASAINIVATLIIALVVR